MSFHLPGVAPADLLRDDFTVLDKRDTLRCAWETEQNLLIQSVIGHAHEGHGIFRGRRFVNTTMDDICRALRLNPKQIRQERQTLIDGIAEYIEDVLAGGDGRALVDRQGRPLLTMGTLPLIGDVDGRGVLRGFYLGGLRDDSDVRIKAEERYGFAIGGGESHLVSRSALVAAGLNADLLAHRDHSLDEIADLRSKGIIVADEGPEDDDVAYTYIRHRRGTGTSDDACVLMCGLVHGFSAAVGAFLADAVDTIEKYVPRFHGQDSGLALRIEQEMPDLNLTRRDVEDIAYLCADESGSVPDSSLRHFLVLNRRFDQCAIEAHFLYLLGRPYAPLGLSHERSSNEAFYEYCENRLAAWREREPAP
ncbi:MAG: hypothetical protein V4671_23565 [Armatimonadota bacterium]